MEWKRRERERERQREKKKKKQTFQRERKGFYFIQFIMALIPRHIRRNLCKRNSEIRVYAANEVFPSTTLNSSVFDLFAAFFTISISVWLLRK